MKHKYVVAYLNMRYIWVQTLSRLQNNESISGDEDVARGYRKRYNFFFIVLYFQLVLLYKAESIV